MRLTGLLKCSSFLVTVFIVCMLEGIESKLILVFDLFRHGSRCPWTPDKNNTNYYKKDVLGITWRNIPGENSVLTEMGVRQHYILGFKQREKYVDQLKFIEPSFSESEFDIFATKKQRTILSLQAQLFGLYPPGTGPSLDSLNQSSKAIPPGDKLSPTVESEILNLQLNMLPKQSQIFPIKELDPKKDDLLESCPRVPELEEENGTTSLKPFMDMFSNKYLAKLKQLIGFKDDNYLKEKYSLWAVSDSFVSGYFEGKDFSNFTNAGIDLEEFNKENIEFLRLYLDMVFADKDKYVFKLASGPLLKSFFKACDRKIANDTTYTKKFVMYSMHDTYLYSLLNVLNFTNFNRAKNMNNLKIEVESSNETFVEYPLFASAILLELHEEMGTYKVKILYNDREIYYGNYTDFKSALKGFYLTDSQIANLCRFETIVSEGVSSIYIVIIIILSIILLLLIAALIYVSIKGKRRVQGLLN